MTRSITLRLRISFVVFVVLTSGCSASSTAEASKATELRNAPFVTEATVQSPDGELRIEFGLDEAGRPSYRVIRAVAGQDQIVIDDSTLGLELSIDGAPLSLRSGASSVEAGPSEIIVDEFDLPTGKARQSTIEARRQRISFDGFFGDRTLTIDVWVDDDAAALRYLVDEPGAEIRVEWERTSLAMPMDSHAWLQPHDKPTMFTPAYERLWSGAAAADQPGRSPYGWAFPALFSSGDTWTLVTEADLRDGAAGSHLSPVVEDGEYFIDLADRDEGNGFGDPRPVVRESWESPWRVIVNTRELGGIVESNHVRHLSGPTESGDFGWVLPGRVSWSWWSDHESSRNPDAMRPFIDLAAEMGWEYSLIDANWNTFDDAELVALVDYARDRGVAVLLWYNSGGPNNVVTEAPRDRMVDARVRQAEFERIAELGVAGVKVDFFHSDKPVQIQQYRDIIRDAAAAELLVNFHGSTMPRGWDREFPNLMTMESVRGAETYTFDFRYATAAPRQNTVLPFTRNVVGPMDFTPVIVGDSVQRLTTNGHELALAVLFESSLQHFVDTPEAYLAMPEPVIELLREVPTVWDEVRFVAGFPEDHVIIARRSGPSWWVGGVSARDEAMAVSFDPRLLDIDPTAPMIVVCDNAAWEGVSGSAADWDDPAQYRIVERAAAPITLSFAPFGGCLVRFG